MIRRWLDDELGFLVCIPVIMQNNKSGISRIDIHFPTVTIIFKRHIATLHGEYSKNILNFIDK